MATTATATPTILSSIEKTALAVVVSVVENLGVGIQPLIQGLLVKGYKTTPTADQTAAATKLSGDLAAVLPDLAAYYQSITAS